MIAGLQLLELGWRPLVNRGYRIGTAASNWSITRFRPQRGETTGPDHYRLNYNGTEIVAAPSIAELLDTALPHSALTVRMVLNIPVDPRFSPDIFA